MTKPEFAAILSAEGYPPSIIDRLWESRPTDDLSPRAVRETTEMLRPLLSMWESIEAIEKAMKS